MLLHYLGKKRSSEICVKNRKPENTIPNIIDHTLNKNQQILIVFAKIFLTQVAIK